jgi:hypothetical protein
VRDEPVDNKLDALLNAPDGLVARDTVEIEDVLTAGYARALELEAERSRIAAELQAAAPSRARRLRAGMSTVTDRLTALRARLDEANRWHRASRQKHLDGRARSDGRTD